MHYRKSTLPVEMEMKNIADDVIEQEAERDEIDAKMKEMMI